MADEHTNGREPNRELLALIAVVLLAFSLGQSEAVVLFAAVLIVIVIVLALGLLIARALTRGV